MPPWCSDYYETPPDPEEDVGTPQGQVLRYGYQIWLPDTVHDCQQVYTGETRRKDRALVKVHMRDVNLLEEVKFTRSPQKDSQTEVHKSVLTDHVAQTNDTINWRSVKLPTKEDVWIT